MKRIAGHDPYPPTAQQGSALLIILILLGLMSVLVSSNMTALNRLRTELQLLERKQQHKFEQFSHPPSH
jgi:type II secretory pathway component PulK